MSNPIRALVLEDSADDIWLLVRQLQLGGYDPTCERIETPEAMRFTLTVHSWDVILADYSRPVSRRLAELMGGSLTLYSAGERHGSTFILALPLAAESHVMWGGED